MATVFDAWAYARPILEKHNAAEQTKGTHTIEDMALLVGKGQLSVWVTANSALLTEFVQYPRMKVLNCFVGAGDLSELRELEATQLIPYAKANGCSRIVGAGRMGWKRTLPGYDFGGIYMHKDI